MDGPAPRCFGDGDPVYEAYHDDEWGRPQLSEQQLYEKICLEGFQAGLAWITVLRKRDALREAFLGFDPVRVAGLDVAPLLDDPRLIRSAPKLRACVRNAEATLALRASGGLPALVREHAEPPVREHAEPPVREHAELPVREHAEPPVREHAELPGRAPERWADIPASTASSAELARRLKRAGFTFVGPTTVYSLLQACGLVGDHLRDCPARQRAEAERAAALR